MNAAAKHLLVMLGRDIIGDLRQDPHGQIDFTYRDSWRADVSATPLSLSMPLPRRRHPNAVVEPYLRGLLPDSDNVLQRWGRRFGVPANSPFALLSHVGEDVAGAARFVRSERIDAARADGELRWVDDAYVATRLRALRGDRAAWDDASSPGQFSLAGAQSKFALYRSPQGRWAIPTGRRATTHIVKPPLPHLAYREVNEHLCLRAAGRLGMRTARSSVANFDDETAIVVERYDRIVGDDGDVTRIHQEDMCQALGVFPARKYEREDDGPGMVRIVTTLVQRYQSAARALQSTEQLVRALAFNWVIYGPDAHAKNYSLLLRGGTVLLAPLYDISSVVSYPDTYDLPDMTMAMSVNGEFQNRLVVGDDWVALARALSLDGAVVLAWVNDVVTNAPRAFAEVVDEQPEWIRELDMTRALVDGVATASRQCVRFLEPSTMPAPRGPRHS